MTAPGNAGGAPELVDLTRPSSRAWVHEAIRRLEADAERSADTHLYVFPLPADWDVDLYVKDEAAHPTGSLKHRLARSLVLYGLCNGWITEGRTLVEASSGSTAVSEAYFARLLGLPFVAVMPRTTSPEKVELIERQGGRCHLVEDPTAVYAEAERVAGECGGHYLDQFTHAERATDWRGNNNIAESVFAQLRGERHPVPEWVVVGAGTGGTSATIGRYVRLRRLSTRVACVDPEGSVFLDAWRTGDRGVTGAGSRIEGIGRPRVEPSFLPEVVDRMLRVPDAACVAGTRVLRRHTGHAAGGSTGANLWASLRLVAELRDSGEGGSVVTLMCDRADRYEHTLGDPGWLDDRGIAPAPWERCLQDFLAGGSWSVPG